MVGNKFLRTKVHDMMVKIFSAAPVPWAVGSGLIIELEDGSLGQTSACQHGKYVTVDQFVHRVAKDVNDVKPSYKRTTCRCTGNAATSQMEKWSHF